MVKQLFRTTGRRHRPRPGRTALLVAAAGVLALTGAALPATTAAATGSALYIISATNPEFQGSAGMSLTCGRDALYGVGATDTGGGAVVIDRMEATSTNSASFHALQGGAGATSGWSLTGKIVCGPAQPGMQVVSQTGLSSSTSGYAYATCPSGQPLSGGWRVNATPYDLGRVVVTGLIPTSAGVSVDAYPDPTGVLGPFTVTSTVICAQLPSSAGLNYPLATTVSTTVNNRLTHGCASGESATGPGFWLTSRNGEHVVDTLMTATLYAGSKYSIVTVDPAPTVTGSTTIWAYAVCATL